MTPTERGAVFPDLKYRARKGRNQRQGCSFYWSSDNVLMMTRKTCPYPTQEDWSAKACVAAGQCGCANGTPFKNKSHRFERSRPR